MSAIRESYKCFPSWSQPFWTLLKGKPLPKESPFFEIPPFFMLLATLFVLFSVIALHLLFLKNHWIIGIIFTPLAATLVSGSLHKIQVVYVHHCVHNTFFQRRKHANRLLAEFLTIFAFVQNFKTYREEHLSHHNRKIFSTIRDADAALIYRFGIKPGLSVEMLWRTLWKTIVSPDYHLYFLKVRLISNFLGRSFGWKVIAAIWLVFLLVILPWLLGFWVVFTAVWVPFFLIYHINALLQFLTEHIWLTTEQAPSNNEEYADRCIGRFCGEATPAGHSIYQWLKWWLRTIFFHLPLRFGVLVGDLPAHDWHHLYGFIKDRPNQWTKSIYLRQKAIDEGRSMGMERREFWGLFNIINHVFHAMANTPKQLNPSLGDVIDNKNKTLETNRNLENSDAIISNTNSLNSPLNLSIPVAMGYVPLGAVFGFLLTQAGAAWWLAPLSSLLVFAGAAQFMVIPMLAAGAPLSSVALATAVINLRHVFYGLSLLDKLPANKWHRAYLIWTLTDENYSVLTTLPPNTPDRHRVMITLLNHSWWILGALIGALLGAQVSHSLSGIEFSLAALFAVLAVEQWRATQQYLPIVTAVIAYVLASWCLPPHALTLAIAISLLVGMLWAKKRPPAKVAL